MDWYRIASFTQNEDLRLLNLYLRQQGFQHRITEEQGDQVLWVLGEEAAQLLNRQFQQDPQWYQQLTAVDNPSADFADITRPGRNGHSGLLSAFFHYPITLLMILGGIAGTLLVSLDSSYELISVFTFQKFVVSGDKIGYYSLEYGLGQGQLWRLVTPVFLHFGLLHLLFNGLWLWEFGRRVEPYLGSTIYFSTLMLIAVSSNLIQYLWEGPALFGGLSGVVYGLVGFCWMRQRFYPGSIEPVMPGLIGIMLLFLALGLFGVIDWFVAGRVANAAHVAGLLAGMAAGLIPYRRAAPPSL